MFAGMLPKDISAHLHRSKLLPVIGWLRPWALTATYGEIVDLVGQVSARERELFVTLLRDVISDYPETTWGLPVLFHHVDPGNGSLHLPLPEYAPPEPSVRRMAWLELTTLRDKRPFGLQSQNVFIPSGGMHCAVLLVQTAGPSQPELPDSWWGEFFQIPESASLRISSRTCLPWPDAVEAACAMLSAARTGGTGVDTPRLFLADDDWAKALYSGVAWRRTTVDEDI